MNRFIKLTISILSIALFTGCHPKGQKVEEENGPTEVTLKAVKEYAQMLEESVLQEKPTAEIFDCAFDTVAIKKKIAKNSIAASAMDLDYGKEIFEGNLNYGARAVAVVENGGDFRLDTCYGDGKLFHAVFRIYDTLGSVEFDDFTIGQNAAGELKIQDCFIYNLSCWLTEKMESEIVYNAMRNMESLDSTANLMGQVILLHNIGDFSAMLKLLKENPGLAKTYPAYNMYYLIGLRNVSEQYISDLEWLEQQQADKRFFLTHAMSYYASTREIENLFDIMNQLMSHTGDDPIYWVLFGKSLTEAGQYADALNALQNAKIGLGKTLWDIWICELKCYRGLADEDAFNKCLATGKELFGMSDEELAMLFG